MDDRSSLTIQRPWTVVTGNSNDRVEAHDAGVGLRQGRSEDQCRFLRFAPEGREEGEANGNGGRLPGS